ncbi:DNA polymerase III, alpha subunit [Candidatus Vecturithrix granuli]|uniref:DNA polymerase III, alpha subunit n=1 Tax=Vecturithrix granuli TaxID=1499967 RepID=A0A081C9C7_VECG1|nr:DNA polymerase III, alpha subunit [Candidatus Vecturithrix granuli]
MALNKHELLKCTEEAVSAETKDENLILSYFNECCDQFELEILPLDINKSQETCEFEGDRQLRLGFSAIAPGGQQFVEDILAERQKRGGFRSFQDFCERLDLDAFPEHFLTRCIEAGVFDATGELRSRLFNGYERILQGVRKAKADRASQQISLFAILPSSTKDQNIPIELPKVDEWTEEERIDHERHGVGFSFSAYLQQREERDRDAAEDVSEETVSLTPDEFSDPGQNKRIEPSDEMPSDMLAANNNLPHSPALTIPSATAEIPLEPAIPVPQSPPSEEILLPPEDDFKKEEHEEERRRTQEENEQESPAPSSEPAEDHEDESIMSPLPKALIIQLPTQTTTEQTLLELRDLLEQSYGDMDVLLEFSDPSHKKTIVKTDARYTVHVSDSLMQAIEILCGQRAARIMQG